MNRGQGAGEARRVAQFLQGHVRLAFQVFLHRLLVRLQDQRLAATQVMARCNVTSMAALLDELFDHPERNLVAAGDLVAGTFTTVIGSKDPFTQIHREGGHARC